MRELRVRLLPRIFEKELHQVIIDMITMLSRTQNTTIKVHGQCTIG
jgi:hypothetical protein